MWVLCERRYALQLMFAFCVAHHPRQWYLLDGYVHPGQSALIYDLAGRMK